MSASFSVETPGRDYLIGGAVVSLIRVRLRQSANGVVVEFGDGCEVHYDVLGFDLPELTDHTFALWHALPFALRKGFNLEICGPVDRLALANAEQLVRIWETWQPTQFRNIRISAWEVLDTAKPPILPRLTLYSGGVDSSYMLLRKGAQPAGATLLTVHGMDYDTDNHEGFAHLLLKTQQFVEKLNYRRVILRTDARKVAGGHHAWGMALSGHAHLFSSRFSGADFAADLAYWQDFLAFPWGLNHATAHLLSSACFGMQDLGYDRTRAEKLEAILEDEVALNSVNFCTDKKVRPANCGICSKCLRTKAMFAACSGQIPDIFLDSRFDSEAIFRIDLRDKIERCLFIDIYQTARSRGNLAAFPEIGARFAAEIANGKHRADHNPVKTAMRGSWRSIRSLFG